MHETGDFQVSMCAQLQAKILKRANTRQQLREKAAQRKNLAFTARQNDIKRKRGITSLGVKVEKILCSQSKGLEVPGMTFREHSFYGRRAICEEGCPHAGWD